MLPRLTLACLALLVASALHAEEPTRIRDVIYAKHDGVALTMDVFKPAKPNGAAVVKIISGGWRSDHKGINDGTWPSHGYTTFVVVHGTQPRFQVEEIVEDLNRAVRFVRAHAAEYGVDPRKIGVTGGSAGGHLSLMLATRGAPGPKGKDPVDAFSSRPDAVACFYPPTDYLNWFEPGDDAVGIGKLSAYAAAFGPKATTPEGRAKLGRELSPIYWVHKEQPPIYIVHGDADPGVSVTQSLRFLAKCHELGAVCEVTVRKGAGHGGWVEMTEDTRRMAEWFDLQLLGQQPARPFNFDQSTLPSTPVAAKPAVKK
jgi:acetyl esterase/lipase